MKSSINAFLTVLTILLVMPAVLATNGINVNNIHATLSGTSGTVTGSFNLTNTVATDLGVSFTGYTLRSLSNTLTITSLSSRTALAGQTSAVQFSVPISTANPGTYVGTLNVTNSTNGFRFGTVPVTVAVSQNKNYTLTSASATISAEPGKSGTAQIGIVNTGNIDLSGLSISPITLIDSSGNLITVTFSQSTGINVLKGATSTITITASTPAGAKSGTYSGTVTVSGEGITRTFTLNVQVKSLLRISNIDISSADENTEVTRGEEVTVDVDYENIADDIDLDNIVLKYKLLKGTSGTSVLKDINDDPIKDEMDVDDLNSGDDATATFKFTMPFDITDGDDYKLIVELEGENQDNSAQKFYDNATDTITAVIESRAIEIYKAELDTPTLSCGDTSVQLDVGVRITGRNDEDVELNIQNSQLNVDKISTFTLNNDFGSEDEYSRVTSNTLTLNNPAAGTYLLDIIAYYNGGDDKVTKSVTLTVPTCGAASTTTNTGSTSSTSTQTSGSQNLNVVYTTQPATTTQTTVPLTSAITSAPMSLKELSGTNMDWEVVGLVALFAVLAGAAVGLVVTMVGSSVRVKAYK